MITFHIPPPPEPPAPAIVREASRLDAPRLLAAIAAIEGWRGRRGRAGEFGIYQILPSVWRRHSRVSPWTASPAEHRRVALAHLAELRSLLRAGGRDDESAFWVALAWNAGATAVVRGTAPKRSWDYADRARNLYEEKS